MYGNSSVHFKLKNTRVTKLCLGLGYVDFISGVIFPSCDHFHVLLGNWRANEASKSRLA